MKRHNGLKKGRACRQCKETRTVYRSMGLCRKCRKLLAGTGYGGRPLDFNGPAKQPRPSKFLPGDPRKVEELVRRASSGQELFSTLDRVRKVNLN